MSCDPCITGDECRLAEVIVIGLSVDDSWIDA